MSNNTPLGRKLYDAELLIATMKVELENYKRKCDQLEQWKREATEILYPIMGYGLKHPDIKLGSSTAEFVIERCKQYDELKAENERLNDQNKKVHDKNRKLSAEYAALKSKAQRLVDALEKISLKEPPVGRAGCTWGNTNYDSLSVCFGQSIEIENAYKTANAALQDWQNKGGV